MVAHGRVELLAHPLSQKYLQMKWNSYGKYVHLLNLLIYCIILLLVTLYIYFLMTKMPKNMNTASHVSNETAYVFNSLLNDTATTGFKQGIITCIKKLC